MLFFCLQSLDFQGVQGIFTCEVWVINDVIKQDSESGQFDKWVDEYSRIAIEKAGK